MMKKRLYDLTLCTCCAFTIQILSFIILPKEVSPVIDEVVILQTLVLVFLGSLSVMLISYLNFKHSWMSFATSYLVLMSVVIGMGSFVFHLIPRELLVYCSVFLVGVVVYTTTYFLVFWKNKNDADIINERLKRKRGE